MNFLKFKPLIIIFICISLTSQLKAFAEFTEKILAIVNGEVITQTDVDEILTPIYSQYKNTYQGEILRKKIKTAKNDILNQLIDDKLILQEAKKQKIEINEKEIDYSIAQLKSNFQSEEEFEDALKEQNISLISLKKNYQEQLLIKKILHKKIFSKLVVSPAEVSAYYLKHKQNFNVPEQVNLRTISIKNKSTPNLSRKKINEIYGQLKNGAEFVELVEKYSENSNVINAGEMGSMKRGTMRKEIENTVFELKIGEFTKPIETPTGYSIFKIIEKKPATFLTLQEVQDTIRQSIKQTKAKEQIKKWVEKLKQAAFIEVRTDEKKS
ncbi:MAG: hypothetical protein DRP78_06535 [Candidatus Omnitrophota bacterium]|nr:MAG: hypothetical protein DRP78_06535 [Candidatus Omnitrophota bacterium]